MSSAIVIAGSVIGAGFATGKEIYTFFYGGNSIAVGFICFALFFGIFLTVMLLTAKYQLDTSEHLYGMLYGKAYKAADFALNLCYFFVLSTMIAAANLCLSDFFGVSEKWGLFSFMTVLLCAIIVRKGLKGIKIANIITMPLIVAFIVIMCIGGKGTGGEMKIISAGGYVSFNSVMMTGILMTNAKNLTKKECIASAFISAIILGGLIAIVLSKLNESYYQFVPMPLISLAKMQGRWLYVISIIILYLSILTTLMGVSLPLTQRMQSFFDKKVLSEVAVFAAATAFSYIGFDKIIELSFPIIAVFGAVTFAIAVYKLLKGKERKSEIRNKFCYKKLQK